MSDLTTHLLLPYMLAAQAQKHVTHNEALRLLDAMVQLSVLDRDLTAPSTSPADGDRHIVASGATGLWAGWDLNVALRVDGVWMRLVPRPGWLAWIADEQVFVVWNGSVWEPVGVPQDLKAQVLGLGGATADSYNRLSVNTPAVLLNNDGAGIEATVNKAAPAHDAALTFKTGFSARALFGLLGSDDFSIKVSPDGSSFLEALAADRHTGRISFPAGVALSGLAADPPLPADGWLWHNGGTEQLRVRVGGVTRSLSDQDVPWLAPAPGEYALSTTGAGGAATGTLAGGANRIDLFPFIPRDDLTLDRLAVNVTTLIAGALGRIVVYSADASGRPASLLLETGDLDFSTTGVKAATVALTLRRGVTCWLGIRHSSTATLSTWQLAATPDLNGGAPVTTARKVLRRTLAFATPAPASWGYLSSETNAAAATAIWLRAA